MGVSQVPISRHQIDTVAFFILHMVPTCRPLRIVYNSSDKKAGGNVTTSLMEIQHIILFGYIRGLFNGLVAHILRVRLTFNFYRLVNVLAD